MFHLISQIYFTINAIVTLFTVVFKAIILVKLKAQTAYETAMTSNSYPKKYTGSKMTP